MKNILYMAALVALLTSCEASTPPNNAEDKGHDEVHVVEMVFTPGNFTEEKGIYASGFTATEGETVTVKIENDDEDHDHHHSRAMEVEGTANLKADTWYRLTINLKNHEGESINNTILGYAEQRSMHQFFFITLPFSQNNSYVDYRYGDTDTNGQLYDTPIGLTGYIKVSADLPANSELRTVLVHITPPGSKLHNGKPYPFDRPDASVLSRSDLDFKLPLSVTK